MLVDVHNRGMFELQQRVLHIPILQSGVEAILGGAAMALGLMTFRDILMGENWKAVNFYCRSVQTVYTFTLYLFAMHNLVGLRNGWFTVFYNITDIYLYGITSSILFVAAIEITLPGMENSIYQFIVSANNASIFLSHVLGDALFESITQDIHPTDRRSFDTLSGPRLYSLYMVVTVSIAVVGFSIGTRYLPSDRRMCRRLNNDAKSKTWYLTTLLAVALIIYGFVFALARYNPSLTCIRAFGGQGC